MYNLNFSMKPVYVDFEPNYNSEMKISTIIREGNVSNGWTRTQFKKVRINPSTVFYISFDAI